MLPIKIKLLFLAVFLAGCGGSFTFGKDRVVYHNGYASCIGMRCCVPYPPKQGWMVCSQGNEYGDDVFIRYYFDHK
jgi:hypothetical protein